MKILVIALSIAAILFTLLPLIPSDQWFVRVFDFPRLQISFLLIAALLGTIFFLDRSETGTWILADLLAAGIVYQSTLIIKYTFIAKKEVLDTNPPEKENTVSLLVSNVYMENDNYKGFFDNVKSCNPDIILTVETNSRWADKLEKLKENYPHFVEYPLENTYGMLLFSKLELIDPQVKFLIEKDIPSIHTKIKLKSGIVIRFYAVHPEPPVPSEALRSTERDAELVLVGKQIKDIDEPTIVAGDLNDVAWSHTTRRFQRISGLLDPRVGRGFFSTYNAQIPLLRWPLDHVFHSDHFKLAEMKTLDNFNSDHFPVYVKLSYESDAELKQKEKETEGNDIEEANETIEDAKK